MKRTQLKEFLASVRSSCDSIERLLDAPEGTHGADSVLGKSVEQAFDELCSALVAAKELCK